MFVIIYDTESGDRGVVGLFDKQASPAQLNALAARDYPSEVDGDGNLLINFISVRVDGVSQLPEISS